ncbi:MAG: 4-hydroxybenzoate octaprenyltransferase [Proteobacteria bacterium]|nr:4-hydroxybenzoate octaprenyltransferase [Pseudomonadota bacterium]
MMMIKNFHNFNFSAYIELSRFLKPTGFLLLWIPCLFGLSFLNLSLQDYIFKSLIFLVGAISLRTVGCIINDILDRDFDKHVERTKNRPLANGSLNLKQALIFLIFCLIPGFFVFLTLPKHNQYIAILSLLIAVIYPLFKRFTYFPQIILGIAFNSGIFIVAYGYIDFPFLMFIYIGSIFWTLAYDTIYAFQDEKDDSIIGLKSTAVYFKKHPKKIITFFYFMSFFFYMWVTCFTDTCATAYVTLLIFIILQIKKWDPKNLKSCLSFFKLNVVIGLFITLIFKFLSHP